MSQSITSQLLFYKPEDPRQFVCQHLERMKLMGAEQLVNEADLDTMFSMFDITKRGVISIEQANAAAKQILAYMTAPGDL